MTKNEARIRIATEMRTTSCWVLRNSPIKSRKGAMIRIIQSKVSVAGKRCSEAAYWILSKVKTKDVLSEDISLKNASLISYMLQVVKDHPNFYSIYYGRPDGSMLGAANLSSGYQTQHVFDPSKPLLPNSTYLLRVVDRSTPTPSDAWYYKDKNLETLDFESTSTPDFNASVRPWYTGAAQERDRIFLTPYYPFIFWSVSICPGKYCLRNS